MSLEESSCARVEHIVGEEHLELRLNVRVVIRHLWRLVSGLDLTLVFVEEKSLNSELKSLGVDDRGDRKRPVEVNALVDLGNSLLLGQDLVHFWWHLGVYCILKLLDQLITDCAHE